MRDAVFARRSLVALSLFLLPTIPGVLRAAPDDCLGESKELGRWKPVLSLGLQGTPAAPEGISDVDLLADGRLVLLDLIGHRVALFDANGRFDRFLRFPPSIVPSHTLTPRLATLKDGGLVIADEMGDQFFFYDRSLEPDAIVPFGKRLRDLRGLARHPSGDLYISALGEEDSKILHRFDSRGRFIRSVVNAINDQPDQRDPASGTLTIDPTDGTIWLSRFPGYQILHLTTDGKEIGRIEPHRFGLMSGVQIAVLGDLLISTYVTESGTPHADVFAKDGTAVRTRLRSDCPLVLAKGVAGGAVMRFLRSGGGRVEVWREE